MVAFYIWKLDTTKNCFRHVVVICCITYRINVLILIIMGPWVLVGLITLLSQTQCLFKIGANLSKYGHAFYLVCLKSLDNTTLYMARKP